MSSAASATKDDTMIKPAASFDSVSIGTGSLLVIGKGTTYSCSSSESESEDENAATTTIESPTEDDDNNHETPPTQEETAEAVKSEDENAETSADDAKPEENVDASKDIAEQDDDEGPVNETSTVEEGDIIDEKQADDEEQPLPIISEQAQEKSFQEDDDDGDDDDAVADKCCAVTGCRFPNGFLTVFLAQIFVLIGIVMGIASLMDCQFVDITAPVGDGNVMVRRGVGFFFNETVVESPSSFLELIPSGECGFRQDDMFESSSMAWSNYKDFLGDDWIVPRILGLVSIGLGCVAWMFLVSCTCFSYHTESRYLLAFFLIAVVTTLQGLTFLVFCSELCDDSLIIIGEDDDDVPPNCTFGRTAGVSVGAVLAYFAAGVCCWLTSKYPGRP